MPNGTDDHGTNAQWRPKQYEPLLRLQARKLRWRFNLAREESMDLVNGAYVKILQYLEDCEAPTEGGRVRWMLTILRNHVYDVLRQILGGPAVQAIDDFLNGSSVRLENYLADPQSSPSEQAERHEAVRALPQALERLPEDQRDAVIMRSLLGMRVKEIADAMHRTGKSVAGLLRRAQDTLRGLLKQHQ
jgi:RNA polymerase sigma-70 factor (ECF subfamily)